MRILFLNFKKFWGGGEKMAFSLARGTLDRGHQVIFFVKPGAPLAQRLAKWSIEVKGVSYRNPVKLLSAFRRNGPFDLIVTQSEQELNYAYCLALFSSTPIITRLGVSSISKAGYFKRCLHGKTVWVNFVNFSKGIAMMKRIYGKSLNRPVFLPNGVEPPKCQLSNPRQSFGLPVDALVIGMVGRLEERKGCHLLFSAFHLLASQYNNVHLLVVGTGGLYDTLQADTHDRIHMFDFTDNVWDALSCLDVFALPVLYGEGTSNAALEAMCMGIPVITTNDGGMSDIVKDGQTGLIVPKGSVTALEQAMAVLVENPLLRQRLGKAAQMLIANKHSMTKMLDSFVYWAEKTVNEKGKA